MKRQQGFTLIELLIAIAIIGLLLAVAVPSWQSFMIKAKRSEAKVMLTEVANEQMRYFTENNRFASTMFLLGYSASPQKTENGNYRVGIQQTTPSSFVLVAIPESGTSQAKDTECNRLTLTSSGVKGITGTGTAADCW